MMSHTIDDCKLMSISIILFHSILVKFLWNKCDNIEIYYEAAQELLSVRCFTYGKLLPFGS